MPLMSKKFGILLMNWANFDLWRLYRNYYPYILKRNSWKHIVMILIFG